MQRAWFACLSCIKRMGFSASLFQCWSSCAFLKIEGDEYAGIFIQTEQRLSSLNTYVWRNFFTFRKNEAKHYKHRLRKSCRFRWKQSTTNALASSPWPVSPRCILESWNETEERQNRPHPKGEETTLRSKNKKWQRHRWSFWFHQNSSWGS
jgi:hypothetical protein